MKNWKIVQRKFNGIMTGFLFNKLERTPQYNENLYYCYKRNWLFFWKLKRVIDQKMYDNLSSRIKADGYNIRDLYIHSNF